MKKQLWKVRLLVEVILVLFGIFCMGGVLGQVFLIFNHVNTTASWLWSFVVLFTTLCLLIRYVQRMLHLVKQRRNQDDS